MQYGTSKAFDKQFSKLSQKIKQRAITRFEIFTKNPFEPLLSNHPLKGTWLNYRSINITADIRAVYKEINDNTVYFVVIGSHSELYE